PRGLRLNKVSHAMRTIALFNGQKSGVRKTRLVCPLATRRSRVTGASRPRDSYPSTGNQSIRVEQQLPEGNHMHKRMMNWPMAVVASAAAAALVQRLRTVR